MRATATLELYKYERAGRAYPKRAEYVVCVCVLKGTARLVYDMSSATHDAHVSVDCMTGFVCVWAFVSPNGSTASGLNVAHRRGDGCAIDCLPPSWTHIGHAAHTFILHNKIVSYTHM
jgi:hypothetical protein